MVSKLYVIVALALILTSSSACATLKVTDPNDPRFDVTKFRFEDYQEGDQFWTAMVTLLPIGTSRDHVETVLIGYGKAKIIEGGSISWRSTKSYGSPKVGESVLHYRYDYLQAGVVQCVFAVEAVYDASNRLARPVHPNSGCTGP